MFFSFSTYLLLLVFFVSFSVAKAVSFMKLRLQETMRDLVKGFGGRGSAWWLPIGRCLIDTSMVAMDHLLSSFLSCSFNLNLTDRRTPSFAALLSTCVSFTSGPIMTSLEQALFHISVISRYLPEWWKAITIGMSRPVAWTWQRSSTWGCIFFSQSLIRLNSHVFFGFTEIFPLYFSSKTNVKSNNLKIWKEKQKPNSDFDSVFF